MTGARGGPGTGTGALARALRAHLPDTIGIGEADPRAPATGLWPEETLPGAVETRLREFAAGRRAARQAMAAIGQAPVAIPMGRDRAPVWPAGVLGSISHGGGACLALAAQQGTGVALLGLDIEPDLPLGEDLREAVLTAGERAALPAGPAAGLHASRIFSAKETAGKAQYPLSATLLDFHDLEIELGESGFAARLMRPVGPLGEGTVLDGLCLAAEDLIVTALWAGPGVLSLSIPDPRP